MPSFNMHPSADDPFGLLLPQSPLFPAQAQEQERLAQEEFRRAQLESLVGEMITLLGDDKHRDGLKETPQRVVRAWLNEFFSGYGQNPKDVIKEFEADVNQGDLVIVRDIPFLSFCEHHMAQFSGTVDIAYLPEKNILGLSKFARLVKIFASRLQVQERITGQVADALMQGLNPKGCMVIVRADHSCMSCRGILARGSTTVTSAIRGAFLNDSALKHEALTLIEGK